MAPIASHFRHPDLLRVGRLVGVIVVIIGK